MENEYWPCESTDAFRIGNQDEVFQIGQGKTLKELGRYPIGFENFSQQIARMELKREYAVKNPVVKHLRAEARRLRRKLENSALKIQVLDHYVESHNKDFVVRTSQTGKTSIRVSREPIHH